VKRLIVTADDFGLALAVNEAVEQGHRRGILSAASLMVAAPAASDAVARAKRLPRLGVGLHLVLVDGRPVLPPGEIPDLVGPDGRFLNDPFRAGIRIFCSAAARRQMEREIRAQLDAFRATGLALDHVNAHHHFHTHPTVADCLIRLAPEYVIKAVRVPYERPVQAWRATGDRLLARLGAWLIQAHWTRRLKRRLDRAGISHNDIVLGLSDTGAMRKERVKNYLEHLPNCVSELYVHAATSHWAGAEAWPSHYECAGEYEALTDAGVLAALKAQGLKSMSFAGLAREAA
jgi:chitin disaccharide deacetylase